MGFSLFDRLTDEHPKLTAEVYVSEWEQARLFKDSVSRDLTSLLNVRRKDLHIDPAYEQTKASVLNYGVPDFMSLKLSNSADRERIRVGLELAIRQFEPRLARVSVALDLGNSVHPILRFRVSAMLRTDPIEPVEFDAVLSGDSRQFKVTGGSR
ncbi:MAG: type VI secretion system baseplate subunit TssE [Bryobacteraceae bacterium]